MDKHYRNCGKLDYWSAQMMKKYGWYPHFVLGDEQYLNGIDYHTHGVSKTFNHPDLQICISINPNTAQWLFSAVVNKVKEDIRFMPGKKYGELIDTSLSVEFIEVIENELKFLRIIFPDENSLDVNEIFQNQFLKNLIGKGNI